MLTEEESIELVKKAISSKQGWINLAASIGSHLNRKMHCIQILEKIAGDTKITLPVIDGEPALVSYKELLVLELEKYLSEEK